MVSTKNAVDENSKKAKCVTKTRKTGAKYIRYTAEQIEVLERIYATCPNPNHAQRPQILEENPILSGIDHKQIRIWFQNRRSREKHKKQNEELYEENQKLVRANRVLRQQNENLINEINPTNSSTDQHHLTGANSLQPSIIINTNTGLILLAEEAKGEFLSKVIGTAINWIPISVLKLPRSSPFGFAYVSYSCTGVAARVCTTVPFKPLKTIELLKHRPSWSRDCKNLQVIAKHLTNNGGTIELVHTKCYAPTTMATGRDFWTIRYTSGLDDGSIVVCEKSISRPDVVQSSPAAQEFVRGKRLASGFLIRQYEGGSSIQFIDHLDLEASSVPQMVRSLYESSKFIAQNIICTLHHIEHLSDEAEAKNPTTFGPTPATLRSSGQRLSRGFNDGLNGFSDDGWTSKNVDTTDDIIMSIKQTLDPGNDASDDGVICVKASLLLQNVLPTKLMKLLKERRTTWLNFNFPDNSRSFSRTGCFPFPISNIHRSTETTVVLGKTDHENEVVEVVRFERLAHQLVTTTSGDLYHLQISNGLEDTDFRSCSELIFAPITRSMSDEAPLLSSGFRILSLGSNKGEGSSNEASTARSVLVLVFQFPFVAHLEEDVEAMAKKYAQHVILCVKTICLELAPPGIMPVVSSSRAYINPSTTIFQISPYATTDHTNNTTYATNNVPNVGLEIGSGLIQIDPWMGIGVAPDFSFALNASETNDRMEMELDNNYNLNSTEAHPVTGIEMAPDFTYEVITGGPLPNMGSSNYDLHLANLLCQSYRTYLGVDMLCLNEPTTDSSMLERVRYHPYAILCFSAEPVPMCIYANQTALNMLETTMDHLLSLSADNIVGGCNAAIIASLPTIMQQGFAILPPGFFPSAMNHCISYEEAVAWQVTTMDGSFHCLALAFTNWSYI